jgi:nucleoside-diphosphate-sugar epimerase
MRVLVIGGSGHIGTFLVPRLVRAGHDVVSMSRGTRQAYAVGPEWQQVTQVAVDRSQQDAEGTFGATVLEQEPQVVIDLLSFTLESTTALVEAIRGRVEHLVHCGSLWRYGPSLRLPISEGQGTPAIDEYGTQKELIARYLKHETAGGGLVTTSVHPGHIVGPGWHPTGVLGNSDPATSPRSSNWPSPAATRPRARTSTPSRPTPSPCTATPRSPPAGSVRPPGSSR